MKIRHQFFLAAIIWTVPATFTSNSVFSQELSPKIPTPDHLIKVWNFQSFRRDLNADLLLTSDFRSKLNTELDLGKTSQELLIASTLKSNPKKRTPPSEMFIEASLEDPETLSAIVDYLSKNNGKFNPQEPENKTVSHFFNELSKRLIYSEALNLAEGLVDVYDNDPAYSSALEKLLERILVSQAFKEAFSTKSTVICEIFWKTYNKASALESLSNLEKEFEREAHRIIGMLDLYDNAFGAADRRFKFFISSEANNRPLKTELGEIQVDLSALLTLNSFKYPQLAFGEIAHAVLFAAEKGLATKTDLSAVELKLLKAISIADHTWTGRTIETLKVVNKTLPIENELKDIVEVTQKIAIEFSASRGFRALIKLMKNNKINDSHLKNPELIFEAVRGMVK